MMPPKGDTRVIVILRAVVPFFLADSENEKVLFKATTIFFSSAKPVAFISRRYLFDRDTISCFFEFVGQHARNSGYLQ